MLSVLLRKSCLTRSDRRLSIVLTDGEPIAHIAWRPDFRLAHDTQWTERLTCNQATSATGRRRVQNLTVGQSFACVYQTDSQFVVTPFAMSCSSFLGVCSVDIKCVTANQSFDVIYNGISRTFRIANMEFDPSRPNADIGLVETATSISIDQPGASNKTNTASGDALLHAGAKAGYSAIGGLSTQIETIRELVELPLMRPELYEHFGQSAYPSWHLYA